MESFSAIHAALARVRRRLVRQAAGEAALYAGAAALIAAVAIPLTALAVTPARAPSVGGIALGAGLIGGLAACLRWALAARRWRDPQAVARWVGRRAPEVSSDLLSAVQLEQTAVAGSAAVSRDMIDALARSAGQRLGAVPLDHLVPARRLRPAAGSLAVAGFAAVLALAIAPGQLADGWRRALALEQQRFDGAKLSDLPLVGDVRIRLEYPAYTGRPPVTLPAASGDFRAMPGTIAHIETTALEPVDSARLVMGQQADRELPLAVAGDRLTGQIEVTEPDVYRFRVDTPVGPPRVEAVAHAIEIEPDEPPAVELYAPADELDVEGRRRIELAYTAEDDYGIGAVALVWDDGAGGGGRMELPPPVDDGSTAQGKFLWDLADVDLPAGARIAYRLEVSDNDTVTGPNVGRSREYVLRVYSPRERHEMLMQRQRELFDNIVRLLGGRLTVSPEDLPAHDVLNRDTRAVVVEIGGILADLKEDKLAPPELAGVYAAIQKRLEGLAKAESDLLASRPPARKVAASDRRHVAQLEDDVLALADWLDRQRLENLLAITDEIAERRERLESLFEEFARTGSAETLAEIERELRAIEQRMAELAQQRGQIGSDVLDQFANLEAMDSDDARSCIAEVRELMAAGQVEAARDKMKQCEQQLAEGAQALEDMLAMMRGDRFSEQQRNLDQMMSELADLTRDQEQIAAEADELMEQYAERAAEMMKSEAAATRDRAGELIAELRKRIDKIPKRGLTPFSSEELPVVEQRIDDVERMLAEGDLAEALAMARQAELGLDTIDAELAADLDSGNPWNRRTPDAYNQVNRALPVARELVEMLEKATPSPEQIMSPEDRRRMRQLRRRQQAARERAQKLGERAQQMGDELPGNAGEMMAEGLGRAAEPMRRAEQRAGQNDPSGTRLEARDAADQLGKVQEQAKGAARQQRMGNRGIREEPVRIPGADEYRAPEEFREEILEAMKKQAPSGFSEQVKRYYEELIR